MSNKQFNPKDFLSYGINEDDIIEIKESFDLIDSNKNGTIECEELKQAFSSLGVDPHDSTLKNIINDLDSNQNGEIDFDVHILNIFRNI